MLSGDDDEGGGRGGGGGVESKRMARGGEAGGDRMIYVDRDEVIRMVNGW